MDDVRDDSVSSLWTSTVVSLTYLVRARAYTHTHGTRKRAKCYSNSVFCNVLRRLLFYLKISTSFTHADHRCLE
jgi:hypothetical protein